MHWIDDTFNLKQDLLAFEPLQGRHTGQHMTTIVYNILEEYDLKEKLNCITTDNAFNNYTMIRSLAQKLLAVDKVRWDHQKNHIPCLTHIMNLIVQKFLNTVIKEKIRADINLDSDKGDDNADDMNIIPNDLNDMNSKTIHKLTKKIQKIAVSLRSSNI